MAINETISKGNKYRRLKDAANKVWQRISFWTAASDVEFDNGTTLQNSLGSVTGITDSLTSTSSTVAASAAAVASLNSKITSFQTGVDKLYAKFVSLGVTPSAKTLDAIMNAVQSVYTAGVSAGGFGAATNLGELARDTTYEECYKTITLSQIGKYMIASACSYRTMSLNSVSGGVNYTYIGYWEGGSWFGVNLYYVETIYTNQTMTFYFGDSGNRGGAFVFGARKN